MCPDTTAELGRGFISLCEVIDDVNKTAEYDIHKRHGNPRPDGSNGRSGNEKVIERFGVGEYPLISISVYPTPIQVQLTR